MQDSPALLGVAGGRVRSPAEEVSVPGVVTVTAKSPALLATSSRSSNGGSIPAPRISAVSGGPVSMLTSKMAGLWSVMVQMVCSNPPNASGALERTRRQLNDEIQHPR